MRFYIHVIYGGVALKEEKNRRIEEQKKREQRNRRIEEQKKIRTEDKNRTEEQKNRTEEQKIRLVMNEYSCQ